MVDLSRLRCARDRLSCRFNVRQGAFWYWCWYQIGVTDSLLFVQYCLEVHFPVLACRSCDELLDEVVDREIDAGIADYLRSDSVFESFGVQ